MENDYEVLGRLGEGSFGKVYKARHRRTGDQVAVKQIKIGSRSWDEACRSTELQALRALRHPFIVRLRELIRSQWDGSLYYIFEFLDSDLCRLVKENSSGMDEMRAAELIRQIFAGLAHMHQHNFFHRDIKPENVLLDAESFTIRIADLGQARSLRSRPPFTDYVGTRWYRAPECLLRDRTYSSPVDIWASGLIFAELLRGSPIFCGTSTIDQLHKIFTVLGTPGDWPDFARLAQACRFRVPSSHCGLGRVLPSSTSLQVQAVLSDVLALNPRRRPLARKCLEHSFFAQLPTLDLDRMDTHRSRASSEKIEEKPEEKEEEAPISSRPTEVASSARAEVATDLDFDAELDAILGDHDGAACAHSADAGDDSLGLGSIRGLDAAAAAGDAKAGLLHDTANSVSRAVVPPVPPLRVPLGPAADSHPAAATVALPSGLVQPPSARTQPSSVSRASSFDFTPDCRAQASGAEAAAEAPGEAPGGETQLTIKVPKRRMTIGGPMRGNPMSPKSPGSVSVDALLDSLCADFPERYRSPEPSFDAADDAANPRDGFDSPRQDGLQDNLPSADQACSEAEISSIVLPPEVVAPAHPSMLDHPEPPSSLPPPDIGPPKLLPEGRPMELPEEIPLPPMPPPELPLPSSSDPLYTGLPQRLSVPVGKPPCLESPRRSCSPKGRTQIELQVHSSTPAGVPRRASLPEPAATEEEVLNSSGQSVPSVEVAWPGTPAAVACGDQAQDDEEAPKSPALWTPSRRQVAARQSMPNLFSSMSTPSLSSSRRRSSQVQPQTQPPTPKATTAHLSEREGFATSDAVSPSSDSSKAASEVEVVLPGLEEGRNSSTPALCKIGEEMTLTPAGLCRERSALVAWNTGEASALTEARLPEKLSASKFVEMAAAARPTSLPEGTAERTCTTDGEAAEAEAARAAEAASAPEMAASSAAHADGTAEEVLRTSAHLVARAVTQAAEAGRDVEEQACESQPPVDSEQGRPTEGNDERDRELEALRAENEKLRGLLSVRADTVSGREGPKVAGNAEATSSLKLLGGRAPLWSTEEAAQLRRVVKRTIRRGTRDKDALWAEVSSEIGGGRSAKDCKLQYARDYRAHKAKVTEPSQMELVGESMTCAPPSGGFRGHMWGNDSGALPGATGDSRRHFQLRTPSLPEPLFRTGVSLSQVAM